MDPITVKTPIAVNKQNGAENKEPAILTPKVVGFGLDVFGGLVVAAAAGILQEAANTDPETLLSKSAEYSKKSNHEETSEKLKPVFEKLANQSLKAGIAKLSKKEETDRLIEIYVTKAEEAEDGSKEEEIYAHIADELIKASEALETKSAPPAAKVVSNKVEFYGQEFTRSDSAIEIDFGGLLPKLQANQLQSGQDAALKRLETLEKAIKTLEKASDPKGILNAKAAITNALSTMSDPGTKYETPGQLEFFESQGLTTKTIEGKDGTHGLIDQWNHKLPILKAEIKEFVIKGSSFKPLVDQEGRKLFDLVAPAEVKEEGK